MNMLMENMEDIVILVQASVPDPYGGSERLEWVRGKKFKGYIIYDNSNQARIGAAQGVVGQYKVVIPKSENVEYHQVFKRISDDSIYRCVSKDSSETPAESSIQIRSFYAEDYVLP